MAYQRQTWQVNESGILRKKDEPEEELLVFGYACKLFRDDEKALYVDQGKHLIPWMGNESLKIDRYDVRGAVYDLSQFETAGGQSEEPLWFNLSQEELKIEQMCDEERYRALTHNEDEEALYQEEELKRLHQALGSDKAYGQVSYKYDEEVEGGGDKNGEEDKGEESSNDKELDEPFKPPVELDLPQGMVIPESVKLNAIIEKTAMFIDRQGSQMEIVLKIKQSNNPQFQFLSLNSPLHPYYRFLLSAIKTGRYKPVIPASGGDGGSNEQENSQQNNSNSYYLHGSLAGTSSNVDVAPVIPTINYKPSADCAYSMLVNKIKGNQSKFLGAAAETVANSREESNSNSYDGVAASSEERVPVTRVQEELEEDSKGSLSPVTRPSRPPKRRRRKRQQGACAYYDPVEQEMENPVFEGPVMEEETVMYCEPPPPLQVSVPVSEVEVAVTVPPAPTLPVIDSPPADLQLIIDKMASYVAKNGRDFESIVRSKGDPRFHFLNPSNQFYEYYSRQVGHYESLLKPSVGEVVPEEPQNSCEKVESFDDTSCDSLKKDVAVKSDGVQKKVGGVSKPLPVCFSIKKPKESEGLEIKSALPVEESSEGEEDEEREEGGEEKEVREEKVVVENVVRVTEVVVIPEVKILEEQVRGKGEKLLMIVEKKPVEKKIKVVEKEKVVQVGRDKEKMSGKEREKTKLVEKVKVLRKEKEKIAAKDKEKILGKDKEKMVGNEKEKPVGKEREKLVGKDKEKLDEKEREKQLERKRRAAAFLNLINKKQDTNSEPVIGPQLPPELAPNSNEMKSGENSVASTPPSSLSSPNHNPPLPPPPPQLNLAEVPTIEIEDSADEEKESLVKKVAKKKSSHRSCSIPSAKAYMEYYKASESKRLHSEYESLKRSRKSKKKSSRSSSDRKHSHRDLERSRSSSKRRRSSREESDHHSKHKHRRRRSKSREEGEVEEKRRKRKHKEKSYKSKKHRRKEEEEKKEESEESSSSSSESSSSSSSDSD